jgi:hypothetical protein
MTKGGNGGSSLGFPNRIIPASENTNLEVSVALMGCHEHISQLERAIYDEVERRISSEDQIREQLDAKLRISNERNSALLDSETARMYRRIDADFSDRLDAITRQVASISNSLTQLTRKVERLAVEVHQSQERISGLEKEISRCVSLPSGNAPSTMQGITTSTGKPPESETSGSVYQHSVRVTERLKLIEDWLKLNLGPEILRVKESINEERAQREESDEEIMNILSQYTDIMRRHLNSVDEGAVTQYRADDSTAPEGNTRVDD